MEELWRLDRFQCRLALLLLLCLVDCCCSLNREGLALLRFKERVVSDPYGALSNWKRNDGEESPCSWFGVDCVDGKVVVLNLKDLCLGGTLTTELGNLVHIKFILLRNNSFSGIVPKEIGQLHDLEMLDLGYNNFSGPLPSNLDNNLSLTILLIDNNRFLQGVSSELHELSMLSEIQVNENLLSNAAQGVPCNRRSSSWNNAQDGDVAHRRLLQESSTPKAASPSPSPSPSSSPSPAPTTFFQKPQLSPAPTPDVPSPAPAPWHFHTGGPFHSAPPPSASPLQPEVPHRKHKVLWQIISAVVGTSCLLISFAGILFCRTHKVVTVKPWATGLSGQLQKAFVTGVPKLKRSELETACEDFSNIIGTSLDGTVYKGTLSSGVEIAVTSTRVASRKDWSKQMESLYRKEIDTLSKINHKNFANLLGFCEEEEPFTRMMVFEYAPNGTLFEHLHIKEAEHLDWSARLRIAMGMAYCLEHMHQSTPPLIHKNLQSTTVYLTEDYAAKISDHSFWDEPTAAKMRSASMELLGTLSPDRESNVYRFGIVLLEMVTGRFPYSVENGSLVEWASDYLRKARPVRSMVDPTLKFFKEEEVEKLCEVINSCIHADPKLRPTMKEVTAELRKITSMAPDGATPKLSPLWWAELEILSTEAN